MVSNMIYGYARTSTKEQKLDRQIDSLTKYVDIKNIYSDKLSGKNTNRKNYQKLKELVVAGDIVYIHALDRLSRNKRDTIREFNYFKEKGVILRILNMPTTLIELDGQQWVIEMINNIILEVLSSVAEQERITTLERQREGIESAKKRGVKFGRPDVKDKVDKVITLVNNGSNVTNACHEVGIGKRTYYNYINLYSKK